MNSDIIYFDNAATSWPKPDCVKEAIVQFLTDVGANPGRSGHRMSVDASRIVFETRQAIADLFHVTDALRITFDANITEALNLALLGLLQPGDHVITSSIEHNSMMRPLRALEKNGIELDIVLCSDTGEMDPQDILPRIKSNTKLIALNHASNVCGTILPINEVGKIAREHGLLFLVDTAQTAGSIPIDMEENYIDLLAFTGHKGLYGPTGTGGLVVGERVDIKKLKPLKRGGTGSRSESEEHPAFLPDLLESGTQNVVGIAGLGASVRWLLDQRIDNIYKHKQNLCEYALHRISKIENVRIYGTQSALKQTATLSLNVENMDPANASLRLDEEFNIMTRVGLHCAPAAHKTLGTFPEGSIRMSMGYLNNEPQIDLAVNALEILSREDQ